jgi:hypothetical protein
MLKGEELTRGAWVLGFKSSTGTWGLSGERRGKTLEVASKSRRGGSGDVTHHRSFPSLKTLRS